MAPSNPSAAARLPPPASTTSTDRTTASRRSFAHKPSNLTILWLFVAIPLVAWDSGYVLLRPYSMPGQKWHSPIWSLYSIYARVDLTYGWPAYNSNEGFTGAQGLMNVLETAGYCAYLWYVFVYGTQVSGQGKGAPGKEKVGLLGASRRLTGRKAGEALVLGTVTATATVSKTMVYGLREYYSGWHSIGHNTWPDIIQYWILPNGFWLIFPTYMLYVFCSEILEAADIASQGAKEE